VLAVIGFGRLDLVLFAVKGTFKRFSQCWGVLLNLGNVVGVLTDDDFLEASPTGVKRIERYDCPIDAAQTVKQFVGSS
jgi:hypothetical protein